MWMVILSIYRLQKGQYQLHEYFLKADSLQRHNFLKESYMSKNQKSYVCTETKGRNLGSPQVFALQENSLLVLKIYIYSLFILLLQGTSCVFKFYVLPKKLTQGYLCHYSISTFSLVIYDFCFLFIYLFFSYRVPSIEMRPV